MGRKPEPRSVDETVLGNLNERLTVIRERDSAVVSIYVRSADPQLAAGIANAIAAEHVKRRAGQMVTDTAEATVWLQQEIEQAARQGAAGRDGRRQLPGRQRPVCRQQWHAGARPAALDHRPTQITDAQERKNAAQSRAELIRGADQFRPAGRRRRGRARQSVVIQ